MASTYLSLHYHLVFATKNRDPLIAREWRPRLHQYLGGTVMGLGCVCENVGGVADHVMWPDAQCLSQNETAKTALSLGDRPRPLDFCGPGVFSAGWVRHRPRHMI